MIFELFDLNTDDFIPFTEFDPNQMFRQFFSFSSDAQNYGGGSNFGGGNSFSFHFG